MKQQYCAHCPKAQFYSILNPSESKTCIMTAEAERIGKCKINLRLYRFIGYTVQITDGILLKKIDSRRNDTVFKRKQTCQSLDSACRSEHMSRHGFGRAYKRLISRFFSKRLFYGNRLSQIDVYKRQRYFFLLTTDQRLYFCMTRNIVFGFRCIP